MMQYTDRHFRYLARRLSRHSHLYTEMVVATALLRGDHKRLLAHSPQEYPVALQLGGSVPKELAAAARMGEDAGYCEINLNVGCPSDRVQSGRFGACLIAEPELVATCVAEMQRAVQVPVTVKTRLGVDDCDSYEHLVHLVGLLASTGCKVLVLHARKALLNFSPRENRDIPPLDYARVYAIKKAFPSLTVVINGGINSLQEARSHLEHVDGVMLGRAAYAQLSLLREADRALFGATELPVDNLTLLQTITPYLIEEAAKGTDLRHMTRHWNGLRQGEPGAREWRRLIATHASRSTLSPADAIAEAIALLVAGPHYPEQTA